MAKTMWGDENTQFFYELSPDKILDAVEKQGFILTGRCLACNSLENRVYEVEFEPDQPITSPSDRFLIAKFYRPGRWSQAQILEEHAFLADLVDNEIPAIAPLSIAGNTLFKMDEVDIYYALFPKRGGRAPDEMSFDELESMGRLLARLHAVGKQSPATHRLQLNPLTYGQGNLDYLLENQLIPSHLEATYQTVVREIVERSVVLFDGTPTQRIHGDCHIGNVLLGRDGLQLFDFDDMVVGPPVQDIWLVLPGRDQESITQRHILLEAYETMCDFNWQSLKLIEPLRALRYIHFTAWLSKRWQDPAFQRVFTDFNTNQYWEIQIHDLNEQLGLIRQL